MPRGILISYDILNDDKSAEEMVVHIRRVAYNPAGHDYAGSYVMPVYVKRLKGRAIRQVGVVPQNGAAVIYEQPVSYIPLGEDGKPSAKPTGHRPRKVAEVGMECFDVLDRRINDELYWSRLKKEFDNPEFLSAIEKIFDAAGVSHKRRHGREKEHAAC